MRGIFDELRVEASIGKVEIDGNDFEIAFHTIMKSNMDNYIENEDGYVTLLIDDQDESKDNFFNLLEEYINLELQYKRKTIEFYRDKYKNTIKWIMAYLFVNATSEEFLNPKDLLKRRINFLKDTTFDEFKEGFEIPLGAMFKDSNLCIKKSVCLVSMETPYRLDFSLTRGSGENYQLPSVYYGISDGVCYLYGIQNSDKKKIKGFGNKKYQNEMNRLLYKINDGVPPRDSDFYQNDENIVDVTHSFVLVLDIFTKLLKSRGINTVKAVTYLPVRYQGQDIWANTLSAEKKELSRQENDRIQSNLTDKFIRTIRRLEFQDSNLEITSYPYENDEYITFKISENGKIENSLLKDVDDSIKSRR